MQRGSVGGSVSGIPLGLGFESQVPQIFVIIFIQVIACDSAGVAYHGSPDPKRQMAFRPNLMVTR